jgi:hypothetical protein
MVAMEQAQNLDPSQSPDMQNFQVYQGVLRKRPGFQPYPRGLTSMGGRVCGLYSTHDVNDKSYLFAAWEDGIVLYDALARVWNPLTGTALTGLNTDLFSWATSQAKVAFSQGVDPVQIIDLVTPTSYARLSVDCPAAKYMTRFADRLFLGFTVEATIPKPFRVRWPVNNDHTNWTGIGSGFRDTGEEPNFVRNILKLQNSLGVYTERSIWLGERTGAATAPTRYTLVASDVGLYSARTLVGFRESHFFLGPDNFYLFNGGAPTAIGEAVRDAVFSELNPESLNNSWSTILSDTQEYLTFCCTGDRNYPSKIWAFNYGRNIWYPWVAQRHTCGATHRLDATVRIDDLIDTIDAQTWLLDDVFNSNAYPSLLTGHTNGLIYRWSNSFPSDDGIAIDAYWTSKDLTADDVSEGFSHHFVRIKKVGVSYRDPGSVFTLLFSFSTNGGRSWSAEEAVTMGGTSTGGHGDATWFREITDKRVRIKFRNNSASETPLLTKLFFDMEIDAQVF